MRRLILAALLCTTAIPAEAAPVVAFVGSVASSIGGAFAAGGIFAAGGSLAGLGQLALSVGFSAISAALRGKPPIPAPSDRMTNYAQGVTYMERVYGRVRKGGPLAFVGFVNNALHYAVVIAAHPTLGRILQYLDHRFTTINPVTGAFTIAPFTGAGSARAYTGSIGQTRDPTLGGNFPALITTAHDFKGLSYLAVTAGRVNEDRISDVYSEGREWRVNAVWDGHNGIYDPRSMMTGHTANAALIIAHEILHHGKTVNWAEVGAQASLSDEIITTRFDGPRAKWLINGTLDDSMSWETVRDQLAMACDAWFYERPDGGVGFKVGGYEAPAVTLTDRDFKSIQIAEGSRDPDTHGSFVIRYIEPEREYVETLSAPYIVGSGPQREEQGYLIDHSNQAQRIAKRMGKVERAQYQLSGTIGLIGYELRDQRFVRVTHAELGMDEVFEIQRPTLNAGGMTFSLEALSVVPSDFAFDAATEEAPRQSFTVVPSEDVVPLVSGLAGADFGGGQIEWTWPAQPAGLRQQILIMEGADVFGTFTAIEGQTRMVTTGHAGAVYTGQVRNRTATGRVSAWQPVPGIDVTASGAGAPPETFETVAKNLDGIASTTEQVSPSTLVSTYANGIIKTVVDVPPTITVTLSGSVPGGVDTVKTITFTGDDFAVTYT